MQGFVCGWIGGEGGVALIRFPGGFGPLEIVQPGFSFFCYFFDIFSIVFCTSTFTVFYGFRDHFGQPFSSILASFWHSFSDADF